MVLDLETTGLDIERCPVWEVGAVRVDLSDPSGPVPKAGRIVSTFHGLIEPGPDAQISYLNPRLHEAYLEGEPAEKVWRRFSRWVGSRCVGAFNDSFDRPRVPLDLRWMPCIAERASYVLRYSGQGYVGSTATQGRPWSMQSLSVVASKLKCRLQEGNTPHDALPDAVQAAMILLRLESFIGSRRDPMRGWEEPYALAPTVWQGVEYPTLEHACAVVAGMYMPEEALCHPELPDTDVPVPPDAILADLETSKFRTYDLWARREMTCDKIKGK